MTEERIVLSGLEGNEPTSLGALQSALASYYPWLEIAWWVVLGTVSAYMLYVLYCEWIRDRS